MLAAQKDGLRKRASHPPRIFLDFLKMQLFVNHPPSFSMDQTAEGCGLLRRGVLTTLEIDFLQELMYNL